MTYKELQNARTELDMTQAELAYALGVQRNTVARYEISLLEIPRTIELAVTCLLMLHRKYIGNKKPTRLEIAYVKCGMSVRRTEVKSQTKR